MADFSYTAITREGRRESSIIQAPNALTAGHLLKEQGLLPLKIEANRSSTLLDFLKSVSTISLDEKIAFIENLSVMLKAGISLSRGMQILVKQTNNLRFKKVISDVSSQVQAGKSLAEAMSAYPNVFSGIFVSMVKVGEMSGNLDKSLQYLTVQLQRDAEIRSKTKGAMIYPAVIVSAMVIIGIVMSIFVLPKLTSIFKEFNSQLPLITRIVIHIADFMGANGLLVVVGLVLLVVAAVMYLKTYQGKKSADIFLLHFFIIKDIIKKINLARFARILSSLLKSGIPIVESLEVTGNAISSLPYQEVLLAAATDVRLGKNLTDSLGENPVLFSNLVVQMLQVGEESGTLENILEELAVHYEEDVDNTMKNLVSVIEPLLLLFIGGIVGVLALALITPIYNIGQSIK